MIVGSQFTVQGPIKPKAYDSFKVSVISRTDRQNLENILAKMISVVADRGFVTIVALRHLAGAEDAWDKSEYEYHWGWTSLKTGAVLEIEAGRLLLSLPPAQLIDRVK